MKNCVCGCGGTTKGGDFLPGHDARHKSALFREARAGNAEALAEIDQRNWMHLYDKSIPKRETDKPTKSRSREALGIPDDGMPKAAHRLDWHVRPLDDIPDDEIWDELTKRTVHVVHPMRPPYSEFAEDIDVEAVRVVHENGDIELYERGTGHSRVIRVADCRGTW